MRATTRQILPVSLAALTAAAIAIAVVSCKASAQQSNEPAAPDAVARRIGTIKTITGNTLTLTPDSAPEVAVTVQPNARLLRIAPGEKDLKNATPIQFQDLQAGDRILVGGKASDDAKAIAASSIVVMKRSDVAARQQQELQDWQKRGVGGLASAVDPAAGTITISVAGFGGAKNVVIHISRDTVIRRYAPNSVKFNDARPSSLPEIHPGDQLRGRGNRNADGSQLDAEEIVSGNFPYVEGMINSIDASASTISVQDVLSKKNVTVQVTPDSQLRQLPVEVAQRIAMRLKMSAGVPGSSGTGAASGSQANSETGGSGPAGNGSSGGRRGGSADLQQMLNRLPPATLADLHKGDAVLIVATQGTSSERSSVINLYSGVDAILRAAPGSEAMLLGPWSLGAPSGDAGAQ